MKYEFVMRYFTLHILKIYRVIKYHLFFITFRFIHYVPFPV